jgi:hypothetical protein
VCACRSVSDGLLFYSNLDILFEPSVASSVSQQILFLFLSLNNIPLAMLLQTTIFQTFIPTCFSFPPVLFPPVFIPTCFYSHLFLFPPVFIPTCFYSHQFFIPPVFHPNCLLSQLFLFPPVFYSHLFLFPPVFIPICFPTCFYPHRFLFPPAIVSINSTWLKIFFWQIKLENLFDMRIIMYEMFCLFTWLLAIASEIVERT